MAILFNTDKDGNFMGKNINNLTFGSVIGITYNIVRQRVKVLAKNFT